MTETIYKTIQDANSVLNSIVWGTPILCLIIFTGIFYTIKTRALQIRKFPEVLKNTINSIFDKGNNNPNEKNVITRFQALSTALAATIGTGNIAGVSTAIVVGGPGSIFWMWVCAILGMITHFAEVVLGIYFRKKDNNGYSGGPMYYLEYGLGEKHNHKFLGKTLAILFATFTFIASFGTGNMTQINSISDALNTNFSIPNIYTGIFLAIVATLVIIGGISRIGKVAEKIVPAMSVFYIIIGLIIVIANIKQVPYVFYSIFSSAFNTKAIAGGVFGYIFKRAMTYGFKRGAFSNEAGLGSSVIAHTASNVKEPVEQGMWGIFEVFFDTIVVCTFTALIILSTTMPLKNYNDQIKNLTIEEQIVSIDNSNSIDNEYVHLINNDIKNTQIKVDSNNNAVVYEDIPDTLLSENHNIEFIEINAYGKTYFVEAQSTDDNTENDYYFGNVLKLKLNPIKVNNQIQYDENNNPKFDSLHIEKVNGVSLVTLAVSSKLSHIAGKVLAIAISLFAFSTTLGWSYYGTKAIEYLGGKNATIVYKILFIIFIIIGATMNLNLAWDIADTMNGLMTIPNLIGILLLSGTVMSIVKNYNKRLDGENINEDISYFK